MLFVKRGFGINCGADPQVRSQVRAGPPGPAPGSYRTRICNCWERPARGPAADQGVRPTIYADGRLWEKLVALRTNAWATRLDTQCLVDDVAYALMRAASRLLFSTLGLRSQLPMLVTNPGCPTVAFIRLNPQTGNKHSHR